jgi:putative transposase
MGHAACWLPRYGQRPTPLSEYAEDLLADGRQRVVRHGYGPERSIQTGIGALDVQRPKVRDRATDVPADQKIRFTSAILPKWARRSRSLDALLPVLYLRGISTGDFQEALAAILGKDAPNLSPSVVTRLTGEWQQDYDRWQRRDLSARRYVYIWADGVYLQARMEPQAECMLVILGATPEGKKELVGFQVGLRESAQSWRELLVDIKARGLAVPPEIAVGDGAMGFWKALDEVFPGTRHQRCWVHKIANVLNKFPKSMQPAVKADLREIWQAETRAEAETATDTFAEKYGAKYEKAVTCLTKDREALLAFYDFPGEHWDHLRTGNPIESVFATVRHRTVRTKGALSQKTAKLMVFKLVQAAAKDVAPPEGGQPVAFGHRRRHIHRRCRQERRRKPRRLIRPRHPKSRIAPGLLPVPWTPGLVCIARSSNAMGIRLPRFEWRRLGL